MQISDLRREVRARLLAFAWDQWAQMGVFGAARRADRWGSRSGGTAALHAGGRAWDARLFDEVLDWLALNERLVSVQRLRNLYRDERIGRWPKLRLPGSSNRDPRCDAVRAARQASRHVRYSYLGT